jgi:hypothetical protein
MPPLLAESATAFSATQLGAAVGILLLVLTIIVAWKKAFGHEPPLHKEYALRADHDKLAAKMDEEFKRERLSRKGLYEKVEAQGNAIASLRASTEAQTKQLTNLDAKMDQVLLRLPRKGD